MKNSKTSELPVLMQALKIDKPTHSQELDPVRKRELELLALGKTIYTKDTIHLAPIFASPKPEPEPVKKFMYNLEENKALKEDLHKHFLKSYFFRTVSEIRNLKNCTFRYDNVKMVGIYDFSQKYQIHYLREPDGRKKVELDFSLVDKFPDRGYLIYLHGNIKFKPIENGKQMKPYIFIHRYYHKSICMSLIESLDSDRQHQPDMCDETVPLYISEESDFSFVEINNIADD